MGFLASPGVKRVNKLIDKYSEENLKKVELHAQLFQQWNDDLEGKRRWLRKYEELEQKNADLEIQLSNLYFRNKSLLDEIQELENNELESSFELPSFLPSTNKNLEQKSDEEA
ncbi:hypothetical protein J6590_107842, partial [Homalodisca vitripennis]